jgi:hypothetical protein
LVLAGVTVATAAACGSSPTAPDAPRSQVVVGSGDVSGSVAEFRGLLGDPVNGATAGSQAAGRREINWDGVPANLTNNAAFPGDFFNTRSPRGLVLATPGAGFRISDGGAAEVDPAFATEFAAFSPRKTFLPEGSNVTEIEFRVPGSGQAAAVRGFGVVFSDVDRQGNATVEFFGRGGSLGRFEAPAHGTGSSLSFLGVVFEERAVTRVRIVSGNAAVAAGVRDVTAGGTADLVIMDDFLYDEPQALP